MLVASLHSLRIEAEAATRGEDYRCPNCNGELILKQGRKVIHHFAHKPPTDCTWASGETRAHRDAKKLVAEGIRRRGLTAEIEHVVATQTGDRRADVMAWSETGQSLAFELQHTSISLDEIEQRASSYARAGIAQLWIPFLRPAVWTDGEWHDEKTWFVERYSARPFERWVHGMGGKSGMWMYDPKAQRFWLARLEGHQFYVESTSWYSQGGEEQSAGGYYKWSKRYRELTLTGPYTIDQLNLTVSRRRAFRSAGYNWPAGLVGRFVA